jgi:hypothetical protein
MRRALCLLCVFLCVTSSVACYRYHVYQINGPMKREQGNQPGTEWREKRLNSFFWGFYRQDLPIDNCQTVTGARFGIEEVRVDNNFAYVLGSVATLGIWAPIKVRWRCAKPPVATETLR